MRITPSVGGLFLSWVAGTAAFGDFNPDDPIPDEIMVGTITARAEVVSTGLVSPNLLLHAGDASGRLFVVDQIGAVRLIKHGELLVTPFLDQRTAMPALHPTDERGFTGMAFHPDFADPQKPGHGKFYTFANERIPRSRPIPILDFTSVPLPQGISPEAHSVLREWTMSDPSDDVFTGTTREVVRILQPHHAHCGACVQFGPDGMLYIGLGDGGTHDDQGPGHDPVTGNAQNNSYIYGKILRIDPFGNDSVNGKYGIPPDNPFVGDSNALDEIFLFGLRNPFRFSFEIDATGNKTTQLVIADTGQDDIEEVSRVDVAVDAGANLGWRIKEGTFLFAPGPESPRT
jgi:glucose/arabinose dehydrogenase